MITSKPSSFEPRFGANPPSSPTEVANPRAFKIEANAWNTSAPIRRASLNVGAPTGMIMNSWKSIELSACDPPLMMFIIGVGNTFVLNPPR